MPRWSLIVSFVLALFVVAGTPVLRAQQSTGATPDLILTNGKIITVDERFTVAQAVAVRGDRIVAVGSTQDISRLAGPQTRRIDLRGRSVTPGMIDNHMHLLRGGTTWQWEVRWDGVETRKQALAMLKTRAGSVPAGEWIYTLGGWAIEQFSDDSKPFTREELDAIAPNHPVLLQASYREGLLEQPRAAAAWRQRHGDRAVGRARLARQADGRILEAGFRQLVAKLPTAKDARGRSEHDAHDPRL
jgi:predicted amidohydrolase YtcJ